MAEFIAQQIHNGKYLGKPIVFDAVADSMQPDDTDLKAAWRDANDGFDAMKTPVINGELLVDEKGVPLLGVWVDVRPKPKLETLNDS